MLIAIRCYIQKHQMVTQMQLERHFQISSQVLHPMLDILKARHDIQEVTADGCAADCHDCETPRYFEWVGTLSSELS